LRHQAWDAANGTAAAGFVVSVIAGFNWPQIAAFLAAVYSAFLIGEKLHRWFKAWRAKRG
jgi:preprotein translocase subunit SecF